MNRIPTIIDCDPGIDDVMMLLLALRHEKTDVKLITTSAGNQTQDKVVSNALRFVSYINEKVEIARGLEKPFLRDLVIADHIHGESGIGGVELPEPSLEESDRTAIEAMLATLKETTEPVTIIATGPLTNVGALLLAHPEVKPKIKQISVMGGAVKGGNVTPQAEFNIYVDPEAAELVFNSGVPVVMSGLDVTHKAYLDDQDLARLKGKGTELAEMLHHMLQFYKDAQGASPFHESYYEEVVRLHDLCAAAYVIDPSLFQGDDFYAKVECEGRHTSGATVVDHMRQTGMDPNIHVLYGVDRERFVDLFLSSFDR
ncbi:nucleoside hydrolase [Alkalibacillus aidingensis]|uniref:nucleoside hydrolase n=1 Tax=Alkalibacillus aidingensis TaxID=2747607 RepID=UPI0016603427|nr:nucleoside hydrolase [Alkalibacillus aidingensis]